VPQYELELWVARILFGDRYCALLSINCKITLYVYCLLHLTLRCAVLLP
jgi:hypothetical protein